MDKSKFIVLLMAAVGLVWAGAATAIDVPGSSFEYPDYIGDGSWEYVKDIPGDWTAEAYTGNPWIGRNYSYGGWYPGVGHTGDSYLDMNAGYIYQTLSGETWVEGVTYDLGIWVTTTSESQRVITYVMADSDWANRTIIGDFSPIEVQPDLQTWIQLTAQYTATAADAGKEIGIGFYGRGSTYADDVTFIPEPITLGLLGLGGLGLIRRKRR